MTTLRRWSVDLRWLINTIAALAVLWALVAGAPDLIAGLPRMSVLTLAMFCAGIIIGEIARMAVLTGRETAPVSTASSLALSLSVVLAANGSPLGAAPVCLVIAAGMFVGASVLRLLGRQMHWSDDSARLCGVFVAPWLFREVPFGGKTLLQWQFDLEDHRWLVGVIMVLVGSVSMTVGLALEAVARAGREGAPLLPAIVDELRSTLGLGTALVTSGALIALAESAIGLAALPLFLFPLVLTSFAVQRYAVIRRTYRQTIGALSSLTDRAGYTTPDHARRVADLSLAVGRDLGMGQRELSDLEYAALLHDLGQVGLREPIPAGATVMAAPADQQRIAQDGSYIVRTPGVLDEVGIVLEAQTTPYRQVREFGQDLPLASRIIKVANAYDDLAGPDGVDDERAMERIHLGLGYEYDPRVVESLSRALARRRRTS
jgi:hypothetical protein